MFCSSQRKEWSRYPYEGTFQGPPEMCCQVMRFGRGRETESETNSTRLRVDVLRADLPVLLVRRGVVGDLEEEQVNHLFHLVVVPTTLAHDYRCVKQEDVPAGSGGTTLLCFIAVSRILHCHSGSLVLCVIIS